jgi:hypothetical protein
MGYSKTRRRRHGGGPGKAIGQLVSDKDTKEYFMDASNTKRFATRVGLAHLVAGDVLGGTIQFVKLTEDGNAELKARFLIEDVDRQKFGTSDPQKIKINISKPITLDKSDFGKYSASLDPEITSEYLGKFNSEQHGGYSRKTRRRSRKTRRR